MKIVTWTTRDGEPWPAIMLENRYPGKFTGGLMSSPGFNRVSEGTLDEALDGFSEADASMCRKLFALEYPCDIEVYDTGFSKTGKVTRV